MDYSNLIDTSSAGPRSYVTTMLEVLGETNPWDVVADTGRRLRSLVVDVPGKRLRAPESPGKWSVVQVIQHLADTELLYGYRLRVVATHDRPTIQGIDQDLWADGLHYANAQLEDALALLEAVRNSNLRLLRGLREEQWSRVGMHVERGPETIETMFKLMAAHDLVHLRQIERILKSSGL